MLSARDKNKWKCGKASSFSRKKFKDKRMKEESKNLRFMGITRHGLLGAAGLQSECQCWRLDKKAPEFGRRFAGKTTETSRSRRSRQQETAYSERNSRLPREEGWRIVPHPPYKPAMAPSDYYSPQPSSSICAVRSSIIKTVKKEEISLFFDSQSHPFWSKVIDTLPKKWLTIVCTEDDYIVDWLFC